MILFAGIITFNHRTYASDNLNILNDVSDPGENFILKEKIITSTILDLNFATLKGHADRVSKLRFSSDDALLASGSRDGSIILWDVSNGEIIHIFQGHFLDINGLEFINNDSILVSSGKIDQKVNFWNISNGKLITTWHNAVTASGLSITSQNISNLVLPVNNSVTFRNIETGEVVQRLTNHTQTISFLTISPDGSILASSDAISIRIWNLTTGLQMKLLSGHNEDITSLKLNLNNSLLISSSLDKSIKIWNIKNGSLVKNYSEHEEGVLNAIFTSNEDKLISSSKDNTVKIWQITDGEVLETIEDEYSIVHDITYSQDKTILAWGGTDRTIKLWGNYASINTTRQKEEWPTAEPEDFGFDSFRLSRILKAGLHSFLVYRNGTLIFEEYYSGGDYKYTSESKHSTSSITNSFTSALIGIAIDKGFIQSVNERVIDFFPNMTFKNMDQQKASLTLKNLLTMNTSLKWFNPNDYSPMVQSLDMVQYILDKPIVNGPGIMDNNNSAVSVLLSAIIREVSGLNNLDFALKYLFEPLNIKKEEVIWMTDPSGRVHGGNYLFLTPRNMAKLGHLFLNNGSWEGKQIISSEWISSSTQNQLAGLNYESGYGYHWWVHPNGYVAQGDRGQFIYIIPELDIVIVGTSRESLAVPYVFSKLVTSSMIVETTYSLEPNRPLIDPGIAVILILGFSSVFVISVFIRKKYGY
jgi:WD40 repeat protein